MLILVGSSRRRKSHSIKGNAWVAPCCRVYFNPSNEVLRRRDCQLTDCARRCIEAAGQRQGTVMRERMDATVSMGECVYKVQGPRVHSESRRLAWAWLYLKLQAREASNWSHSSYEPTGKPTWKPDVSSLGTSPGTGTGASKLLLLIDPTVPYWVSRSLSLFSAVAPCSPTLTLSCSVSYASPPARNRAPERQTDRETVDRTGLGDDPVPSGSPYLDSPENLLA